MGALGNMTTATLCALYALAARLPLEGVARIYGWYFHPRFATLELRRDHRRGSQQGAVWIFQAFEGQGLMKPRRRE